MERRAALRDRCETHAKPRYTGPGSDGHCGTDRIAVEDVGIVEETAGAEAAAIGGDTLAILDLLLNVVLLLLGFHLVRIFPNHIRAVCNMPEHICRALLATPPPEINTWPCRSSILALADF